MDYSNPSLTDLTEHSSALYFTYNMDEQKFAYKNSAFNRFFESEPRMDNLDQLWMLIHSDDREYMEEIYTDLLSGKIKEAIEFRIVLQQRTYYLKMSAIIRLDRPRYLTGCAEDITEERAYTKNLMEFTNKKNAVLNIVSHDLAGPLGTIQMLAALMRERERSISEARFHRILSMIETNAKRGVQMIQEFIKKEFLESIGVEIQMKRCNIVEKIEQLMEEYKNSELHLNLYFELNCTHSEIYIMIDDTKFLQAINNLISNSIKFTPDKGVITINISLRNQAVLIEITDTGIGIPKKFHEKLFDKFNLAGRTGLKGENSVGLGMSIIKTIIEWHKGRIWFNSEENKGTTFYIELEACA